MATKQRVEERTECPVCGNNCGKNGYCKTWNVEWQQLRGGAIQIKLESYLPAEIADVLAWVHRIVGKYVHANETLWLATWVQSETAILKSFE